MPLSTNLSELITRYAFKSPIAVEHLLAGEEAIKSIKLWAVTNVLLHVAFCTRDTGTNI